jgi:CheY-like chemotaxis protein
MIDRKSVLVVDEEPDTLSFMEESIKAVSSGGHLDTATSYERARELLASWSYDISIIGMRGADGCKLLKQATFSRTPVVVYLANGQDPETISNCMEMGVKAYITRDKVREIVPFLEELVEQECMSTWRRIYGKAGSSIAAIRETPRVNKPSALSYKPFFYLSRAAQKATIMITL